MEKLEFSYLAFAATFGTIVILYKAFVLLFRLYHSKPIKNIRILFINMYHFVRYTFTPDFVIYYKYVISDGKWLRCIKKIGWKAPFARRLLLKKIRNYIRETNEEIEDIKSCGFEFDKEYFKKSKNFALFFKGKKTDINYENDFFDCGYLKVVGYSSEGIICVAYGCLDGFPYDGLCDYDFIFREYIKECETNNMIYISVEEFMKLIDNNLIKSKWANW